MQGKQKSFFFLNKRTPQLLKKLNTELAYKPAISPVGIDVPQRTKSRGVSIPSQALLDLLDHSSPPSPFSPGSSFCVPCFLPVPGYGAKASARFRRGLDKEVQTVFDSKTKTTCRLVLHKVPPHSWSPVFWNSSCWQQANTLPVCFTPGNHLRATGSSASLSTAQARRAQCCSLLETQALSYQSWGNQVWETGRTSPRSLSHEQVQGPSTIHTYSGASPYECLGNF